MGITSSVWHWYAKINENLSEALNENKPHSNILSILFNSFFLFVLIHFITIPPAYLFNNKFENNFNIFRTKIICRICIASMMIIIFFCFRLNGLRYCGPNVGDVRKATLKSYLSYAVVRFRYPPSDCFTYWIFNQRLCIGYRHINKTGKYRNFL